MKIDKRHNYVLMLDTETANTLDGEDGKPDMSDVMVYDCGWAVVDTHGGLYETASYVNRDVFVREREMMRTAYYAWKIPRYVEEIRSGQRIMASQWEIRQAMLATIEKYSIKQVCAHNAFFDYNALNRTQSYVSKSKYRYWFPFGLEIEWWDTNKMAKDVVAKMPTYITFCNNNGYVTPNGAPQTRAEVLYRFISGNNDFEESHTGLEDVLIESEILWYCFRQKKAMRKELFNKREPKEPPTDFQRAIMASLRDCPTLIWGR